MGKAAGLDTLTAEHLQYSHPAIATVLSKLFYLIITSGHIPPKFGMSFTVPLLKGDSICGRSINVEDFRGISISPVISKVLEHCIIERFSDFLIPLIINLDLKATWLFSCNILSAQCYKTFNFWRFCCKCLLA